jgi:WD40 repeat protein
MIKLYDVVSFRNGAVIQSNSVDIYLCVQLDYTGERLLAGSTDKSVHVYSTSTGKQLHSFVGHGYKVNSVSWTSAK